MNYYKYNIFEYKEYMNCDRNIDVINTEFMFDHSSEKHDRI